MQWYLRLFRHPVNVEQSTINFYEYILPRKKTQADNNRNKLHQFFLLKLKYSLERSLKAKSFGVNIQDHTESAISTPPIIGY